MGTKLKTTNVARIVAIATFALLAGSVAGCSQSDTAAPQKEELSAAEKENNRLDYILGSTYGEKISSENNNYTNYELEKRCFVEYSNLPTSEKKHSDGSRVSEEDFVDGCWVNGLR